MLRLIRRNLVLTYFIVILISIFFTHFFLSAKHSQEMGNINYIDMMISSFYMTLILLPILYLLIWVDIKKRIKVEEELREVIATKDKFFSIIAHDLRSPFQGFIGLTEIMAADVSGFTQDELSTLSKEMHKKASNLYELLVNLLEWAQMQKGTISFSPQDCSLSEIVKHGIDIISQSAAQKEVKVINSISDSIKVYADGMMINSVLRNFLSNAVKFTAKGGKVIVSAKDLGNKMVEVSVTDSGIGMSDALCKKLFKIEEKVGREGTEGETSTGLGLLICKEFIEKNGGKIWVESKENYGSAFKITLPMLVKG
jgi:signal transduction histidine kinase